MMRFVIERQLEIIGEASTHLTETIKKSRPEVDWRAVKAFRNLVGIDYDIIWLILNKEIPALKAAIMQMNLDLHSNI